MGSHTSSPPGAIQSSSSLRDVLDGLRRVFQVLRLSDRVAEKQVGLSGAQLFVLHQLAGARAVSLNELADRTHTHQSSVSVVVQKLVDRDLVRRSRDKGDARRLELTLTPQGRSLLRHAPHAAQVRMVEALGRLTLRDQAALSRLLNQLAAEMGSGAAPPDMLFEADRSDRRAGEPSSAAGRAPRRHAPRRSIRNGARPIQKRRH